MHDFVVCVRSVKNGSFSNEPGPTYFLQVPEQADAIHISHKVSKKSEWVTRVTNDAKHDTSMEENSCGDILVFIHGYNNHQDTVLKRHRLIKKSLSQFGYRGTVVSFDWPSADSALNYLEDRKDAKKTALKLVDDCISLFAHLQSNDCHINVHLLAHSTGAYVVREAFDDADDRPAIAARSWSVSQIMFIGADISARSMSAGNSKTSSIYRHCVRLTNYSNPYDSALKLSNVKRVGVAPRVGRVGLPEEIPHNAVNVDCGNFYDANESLIDSIGNKSHSWYIGNDSFTQDMKLTIDGDIDRHSIPTRVLENRQLHLKF